MVLQRKRNAWIYVYLHYVNKLPANLICSLLRNRRTSSFLRSPPTRSISTWRRSSVFWACWHRWNSSFCCSSCFADADAADRCTIQPATIITKDRVRYIWRTGGWFVCNAIFRFSMSLSVVTLQISLYCGSFIEVSHLLKWVIYWSGEAVVGFWQS